SVAIQITVTPRAIAGDIVVNDEDICADEQVTLTANLAPSSTISNPVFHWFADAALTASLGTGTTLLVNPSVTTTYYIAVEGDNACLNTAGNGAEAVVTVNPAPQNVLETLTYTIEVGETLPVPAYTPE